MSPTWRVAVVGANGRFGAFACEVVERTPGFTLAARVGKDAPLEDALRESRAAIAIETTRAGLGFEHARRMIAIGVRPLVATSGVDEAQNEELDRLARERGLGGLVVPNFSLGAWLVQRAAADIARHFERCEIVELHHEKKRDAPSGTALDTAAWIRRARGGGDVPIHDVPIHSVRLPGLRAHQEVLFGAPGETITLRHDVSGPEAYEPGIAAALRHVATAIGVARGIGAALER